MKLLARVWTAGLLVFCCNAFAADYGTVTWNSGSKDSKPVKMSNAYAYAFPSGDGTEQITEVVLSEKPLKTEVIDRFEYERRNERLAEMLVGDDTFAVALSVDEKGELQDVQFMGFGWERRGGDEQSLTWHRKASHIDGNVHTKDVQQGGGKNCDLYFELDIAGVPDFGPVLPADGGAPFKAYQTYAAAVLSGKADAIAKSLTQADAEDLLSRNKQFNDAHAIERKIKGMQQQILHDVKFVSGNSQGDDARVVLSGFLVGQPSGNKKAKREASQALVKLKRENGEWRVSAD